MTLRAARGAAALPRVRTRSGSILYHLPPSNSIGKCSRIAARSGCRCVRLRLGVCPCGGLHATCRSTTNTAETYSGSGVWLVFSLRTLVCADGICGRVRTFVVTRVPCSVVNSLFAHSTHTDASKGPAPPAESARAGPTPDTPSECDVRVAVDPGAGWF
jgi:hypothetical protein